MSHACLIFRLNSLLKFTAVTNYLFFWMITFTEQVTEQSFCLMKK